MSAFSAIIEAHIYHFLCSVRDRLLPRRGKKKKKRKNGKGLEIFTVMQWKKNNIKNAVKILPALYILEI